MLLGGCTSLSMRVQNADMPCRSTAPAELAAVGWIGPTTARQRAALRAWCEPVGPIARHEPDGPREPERTALRVVSWNMAVGAGSLREVAGAVRTDPSADWLFLIQEAYRTSDAVPAECPGLGGVPGRIAPSRRPDDGDIIEVARQLDLHAVYVPSMRNGRNCAEPPREDRGNAILSTRPLTVVNAIELPFAQQRRVGVAAVLAHGARRWLLASVHFDTLLGHGGQARGLLQALDTYGATDVLIVGGDLNALPLDRGVRAMRRSLAPLPCGTTPTHASGRRLDFLFTRGLSAGATCETLPDRFGSDHHPLRTGPL